jgi:toxin CptA
VAGVLLTAAALSHIGVTIVAFAWLGLAWLALARRGAAPLGAWPRLTLALAISGVVGVALLYVDVAALKVQQFDTIGREILSEGYEPIYALIWRGFLIAFHPLVLLLMPAGLLLLLRRRLPAGGLELVLAWVGTALLFLLVEITTGLQVRYIYFLTPLACILAGLLLDRLAAHGATARRVAWVVAVLLLAQGSAAWLTSAFNDLRMSMVSLLR